MKHGRYSSVKHETLRDLIHQHANDPDPLNIFPELATCRALFEDFINRYGEFTAALSAWYASFQLTGRTAPDPKKVEALHRIFDEYEELLQSTDGASDRQLADLGDARALVEALGTQGEGKPREVLDISDAYRIVSEITKIAERIERIRAQNAITYAQLKSFLFAVERVLETRITDPALRLQIQEDLLGIRP